ncbi:cytochrome P450 [Flagelloscypha sp. PMI_526]|nr:cytochrome P450 [Flagelloscypha sp. PMI_526]
MTFGYSVSPTWVALAIALTWSAYRIVQTCRKHFPPGPPRIPVLGNLLQMPKRNQAEVFMNWSRQYGPLVYLDLAGQPLFLLGSHKIVYDLLEKRSATSSGRPRLFIPELLTGNRHLLFIPPNELWKRGRRAGHHLISPQSIRPYERTQLSEAFETARRLIQEPTDNWLLPIQEGIGYSTFRIIYGVPKGSGTEDVHIIGDFAELLGRNLVAGKHPADIFSWMEYLPNFVDPWKPWAAAHFDEHSRFVTRILAEVQTKKAAGQAQESIASNYLESFAEGSNPLDDAWIMASIFGGANETTVLTLTWFIKAMIRYPHIQAEAHKHLDGVVGRERTPESTDLVHLPYLHAIVKETLRWSPMFAGSVPHVSSEDDVYEGYFIPKGSFIMTTIMGLNRDKDVYGQDADDFNPSRFLDLDGKLKDAIPNTRDESHSSYGFGRRHCLGRHLANQSLLAFITAILWTFEITPGKEDAGKPHPADVDDINFNGSLLWPNPFKVKFTTRVENVELLLDQAIQTLEGL